MSRRELEIGAATISVANVAELASGRVLPRLCADPSVRERLQQGAATVARRIEAGESLYGITTGFGESCQTAIPPALVHALQRNLVRYHGCGTGPLLSDTHVAAVLAVRLCSLARGYSGVRPELLEALVQLLRARVLPCIPARGSVGASGDLTPLSYVAAVLQGDREASWRGQVMPAQDALRGAELHAIELEPKEGLALMNGTSVMTGLGCVAWARALALARWSAAITAGLVEVMEAGTDPFDPRIDALKPHPGQRRVSDWIRADLEWAPRPRPPGARLQARYSIRCAPHLIGVLVDAAEFAERVLEVELNSVNDNPIVDPERGDIINGGNFYGGHVALVLDGLKTAAANVAGLLDRQLVLLCQPEHSGGLPANLAWPDRPHAAAHHGFKALQITASALAAEALKLTMPASVFSRSTESHNQDVVSMGTHAARDCHTILDLAEETAAIVSLAVAQGVDLRGGHGCGPRTRLLHEAIRGSIPAIDEDRRTDLDIARVIELYRAGELPVGQATGFEEPPA